MLRIFSTVGHLPQKSILDQMDVIAHGVWWCALLLISLSVRSKRKQSFHVHHFSYSWWRLISPFWAILVNIFTSSINCYSHRASNTDYSASHSRTWFTISVFFSNTTFSIAHTHMHTQACAPSLPISHSPFDVAQIGMHDAYELKRKLKSKISVSCVDSRHST